MRTTTATYRFAALAILLLAAWSLLPGLGGGFQFDDFANLPTLGAYGRIDNLHALSLYLTSGQGDPTGRPLAMLTFVLDANNWPAEPLPFLRTNILLHLINGVLLLLVLRRLGRETNLQPRHAEWAALLGSALWQLHPLLLSTTLYIIQRETMLAATFVFLGFLLWLHGRSALIDGRATRGKLLLIASAIGCTVVSTLCKANGVLLPLLLLIAEATILAGQANGDSATLRRARVLLAVPAAAVVVYLIASIPGAMTSAAAYRPWTLAQRILTEPRIIVDYLSLLVVPRSINNGLFNDYFPPSTDLLHPWTTLPAIVLVCAFVLEALLVRRRHPRLAFAVLFFFAGHLLESTVIPLELYFEHRNYLPAAMLFWPLAVFLTKPSVRMQRLRAAAAIGLVLALALLTRIGAGIWGNPASLAAAWALKNPDSARAQAYAAQYEFARGDYAKERARLEQVLARHPDEVQLAVNLVDAECRSGGLRPATLSALQTAMATTRNGAQLIFDWLSSKAEGLGREKCRGLDTGVITALLDSARSNPNFANASGRQQDFDHIAGLVALARNDPEQASHEFDRALSDAPRPQVALAQAAALGNFGRPDLALKHLEGYAWNEPVQQKLPTSMQQLHAWLLYRDGYWQNEYVHLRQTLEQDLRKARELPPPTHVQQPG